MSALGREQKSAPSQTRTLIGSRLGASSPIKEADIENEKLVARAPICHTSSLRSFLSGGALSSVCAA